MKYNAQNNKLDALSSDIKFMLDNLIEDNIPLNNDNFAAINKKIPKSFKRSYLECLIYENPEKNAESLYIRCLSHWAYSSIEAHDIASGKKGKLVDYIPEYDLCIYKIGQEDTLKYILMHKKLSGILGYINLSIENNIIIIHNIYKDFLCSGKEHIKLFLEKWFIPKYNLNVTSEELNKALNDIVISQNMLWEKIHENN